MFFFVRIFKRPLSALTRLSYTALNKNISKKILEKGTALFWNIALVGHKQNFWTKFLSIYLAVWRPI